MGSARLTTVNSPVWSTACPRLPGAPARWRSTKASASPCKVSSCTAVLTSVSTTPVRVRSSPRILPSSSSSSSLDDELWRGQEVVQRHRGRLRQDLCARRYGCLLQGCLLQRSSWRRWCARARDVRRDQGGHQPGIELRRRIRLLETTSLLSARRYVA